MAKSSLSPLSLLLCAVFLFSAHVFAVSAVLGVDLGTEYIKATLVKPGTPLEIVLTKDSRRKETAAVAFKPPPNGPKPGAYPERAYGSDAMALAPRFPGDVYYNLKSLLGLPVDHPIVSEYIALHPELQLEPHGTRNTAAFKSKGAFPPEEEAWLVEELLAMELQSIRRNAESLAGSGTTVRSVVVTVPPFYTVEEKRAIELAADLAGLRVLSLISDGLAVGLNYATTRQFPNVNDGGKPEYHMVFDMGAGSTKATVLRFQSRSVKDVGKFNKTFQEVQVLGSGWDRTLGGDALNALIVDDMISHFVETSGAKKVSATAEGVKGHGRAMAKLLRDAERVRHVLSANTNTATSFEGLFEDVDFRYKISRADFEKMAEAHAERVAAAVQSALEMAGLKNEDLDSVILHGGATRTPFVQKQLERIFGSADKLRNNVNSDEAAVFGAGFRAAELSPSFRVKDIRISDGAAYPAGMRWTNGKGKTQHQRLWTPTSHLGATPKEITFNNKEDFTVEFYQQVPRAAASDLEERPTKALVTKNLTATVAMLGEKYSCEPDAVQFKVGLRLSSENGEVEITKAVAECEAAESEKEGIMDGVKNLFGFGKKDQQPLADGSESTEGEATSSSSSSSTETTSSTTSTTTTEPSSSSTTASASASKSASNDKSQGKKKLTVTIPVDYELKKTGVPTLSTSSLASLKDRLKAFEASDRSRRLREETLNQLEGFTYKVRDLLDNEAFVGASTEAEREALDARSREASEWLYGEGADAPRDELKRRLTELQDMVKRVQRRIDEASKRPELVAGLKSAINSTGEFVESMKKQIDEYEAFQASASAAATSSTASSESSTTTAAPSSEDAFAGLEDDEAATAPAEAADMDDLVKERGPVPPMYARADLDEVEQIASAAASWLAEREAAQDALGPTDDPVLTTEELTARRERLDKAGMDFAMRAVRNFEAKGDKDKGKKSKSKGSKSSKTKKGGKSSSSSTSSASGSETREPVRIKLGENGEMPSEEELEELLKQYMGSGGGAGPEAAEQKAKETKEEEAKADDGTIKHEEL